MDARQLRLAWAAGVWDTSARVSLDIRRGRTVGGVMTLSAPPLVLKEWCAFLEVPLRPTRSGQAGRISIPIRQWTRLATLLAPFATRAEELEVARVFSLEVDLAKRLAIATLFKAKRQEEDRR